MSDHPWVFRFAMAALVFAVLFSAAYSYADKRYRRLNQEKYTPKLQWIDTVMAGQMKKPLSGRWQEWLRYKPATQRRSVPF